MLFLCILPIGSGSDGGPDFTCPLRKKPSILIYNLKKIKKIKVKKKKTQKPNFVWQICEVNRILVFIVHLKFGETCADTSPDLTDTISVAIID